MARQETSSLPPIPQEVVSAPETAHDEKRVIVGLAKNINMDDFAKAVGAKMAEVTKDGVTFRDSYSGWSGSLSWQETYPVPIPNPYFSDLVPKSKDVKRRNLRFYAHYWDGGYDSDDKETDMYLFDHAGYVLVIGNSRESFAAFLHHSSKRDSALSGFYLKKGRMYGFSGPKEMFSPEFQEAARISRI